MLIAYTPFYLFQMVVRSFEDECSYLERQGPNAWRIKKGFQPHMNVEVSHEFHPDFFFYKNSSFYYLSTYF